MPAKPPSSGGTPPPRIPNIAFGDSLDSTFQQPRATELVQDDVQVIYKSYSAPSYVRAAIGSAHPETAKFPLHTLLVILRDEQTRTDKLIYTVPRAASVSFTTTPEGQTATVSESLVAASSTPPSPTALRKVTFANLYNETARLTTSTVPTLFGNILRSSGTEEVLPLRFRSASGISTSRETVAGTVPDTLTLGTGEIQRSEEQLGIFTKRVSSTSKSQVITPQLFGQEYDEQFDVAFPYTETLEDSGTSLGDNRKTVTPLSDKLDLVKTISPNTAVLDNYLLSFPSTTTVEVPDFLTGITIALETDQSTGTAQVETVVTSVSGDHSLTLPASASAQGSASVACEVIPHLVPFYGVKRRVTNYLFFMPAPVTSAAIVTKLETLTGEAVVDWSDFKPNYVTLAIMSKRQSARVSASVTVHDSSSSTGSAKVTTIGPETSKEGGLHIKTVRLPPTLHGDITLLDTNGSAIALTGTFTAAVDAYAFCLGGSLGTFTLHPSVNATASYSIVADGLSATEGSTSLPDSGLLIVNVNARPYKYGYVMVNAEVLDASTL